MAFDIPIPFYFHAEQWTRRDRY